MDRIKILIFKNNLVSNWVDAKLEKAVLKEHEGHKEWVVTYTNSKSSKRKK